MVNGERMGNSPYESEQKTKEIFVQNTDRLFELVDTVEPANEQQFFSVEWGREGEIKEAIPLHIAPTGARRQERNDGLFNKAQLKVIGEGLEPRFIWARITAQATGTPIQLDYDALDEDFGYKPLTDVRISQVLAERTQSLSDYLYLTQEMTRRNIELSSSFREPALKLTRELLYQSSALRIDPDSLEGLRYVLDGLRPRYAAKVRHALLADILRTLKGEAEYTRRISFPSADEAADFLVAAMHAGVIPPTEVFTRRILPVDAVYKYPFATELLHSTLRAKPPRTNAKTVAGTGKEIEGFIRRYIITILRARASYAQTDAEPKISGVLQDLLVVSVDEEDDPDPLTRIVNLQGVSAKLLAALREMQSSDPEIAAEQQRLDELSTEIVDMLLRPVINRKIGREAAKRGMADDQPPTS